MGKPKGSGGKVRTIGLHRPVVSYKVNCGITVSLPLGNLDLIPAGLSHTVGGGKDAEGHDRKGGLLWRASPELVRKGKKGKKGHC